jgi:hypothetical protein
MAEEFLKKDWNVVGTVRAGSGRTKLHDLADKFHERLEIETLDICEQSQLEALRKSGFDTPNSGLQPQQRLGWHPLARDSFVISNECGTSKVAKRAPVSCSAGVRARKHSKSL